MKSFYPISILCLASFVLAAAVAWGVFEAVPHLEDEHINLYQAKVFASGKITQPAPPHAEAFFVPFQVNQDGKLFSKYPPGYSLLLAIGVLVGQPWLVSALAAALGLLGVYLLGKDLFDHNTGLLAAALGIISPLYIMLSGTLLSHSSSLAILVFFAWAFLCALRVPEPQRYTYAWLAGGLMGLALAIRPWTAFGISLPFAIGALVVFVQNPRQRLPIFTRMALAFFLVGAVWPVYNLAATGSPLTNTYKLIWPYDTIGFGPEHGPHGHTLMKGWRNLRHDFPIFGETLLGWPPVLGFPLVWVVIGLGLVFPVRRRSAWLLLLPPISLILAQTAYWAVGGGLYGARYYAEAAPFLWILAARGLLKISTNRIPLRLVKIALPALIAWGLIYSLYPRFAEGRNLYDISRADARTVVSAGLEHALVFVHHEYWTDYANLSWLNDPSPAKGEIIFAKDLGTEKNQSVIKAFPERSVYFYNRYQSTQLVPLQQISETR